MAGFGAGAFFFAPLARALIAGGDHELFGVRLFALPPTNYGFLFTAYGTGAPRSVSGRRFMQTAGDVEYQVLDASGGLVTRVFQLGRRPLSPTPASATAARFRFPRPGSPG